MGAQEVAVCEPERILHVASGMLRRDVQSIEVVIFGFHFGAIQNRESKRGEQIFDFVLNDGHRVQAAWTNAGSGERQIQPFLLEPRIQRFCGKCLLF